jgi:hypothetical protein
LNQNAASREELRPKNEDSFTTNLQRATSTRLAQTKNAANRRKSNPKRMTAPLQQNCGISASLVSLNQTTANYKELSPKNEDSFTTNLQRATSTRLAQTKTRQAAKNYALKIRIPLQQIDSISPPLASLKPKTRQVAEN